MDESLIWSDLAGRRVGIYGLGVEGRANQRACQALGITAVLVDDRENAEAPGAMVTSAGGLDALLSCEIVLVSPGISIYSNTIGELQRAHVRIASGLGLWLAGADPGRVVCVTGTKGKSTTAALAGHFLSCWGYRCMVGGNIGAAPWDPAIGVEFDFWVIEVSSYQATTLEVAPRVVVVTSLAPDHLPWHRGDLETYYRDKLSLCTLPGAEVSVANGDSLELVRRAALLGPSVKWVTTKDFEHESWVNSVPLLGQHNQRNALLAAVALREAGIPEASDPEALGLAGSQFAPLEHRLAEVGVVDGVRFVDDSLATNVLPTTAALDSFPGARVALIVGGQDRGIDYHPLGTHIRDTEREVLLLTIPDAGARIATEVADILVGTRSTVRECADLAEAVDVGYRWARPGGIVLLSPAAPSFGVFKDYQERSEAFTRAVRQLASD